jgi:hypothetical protein
MASPHLLLFKLVYASVKKNAILFANTPSTFEMAYGREGLK